MLDSIKQIINYGISRNDSFVIAILIKKLVNDDLLDGFVFDSLISPVSN